MRSMLLALAQSSLLVACVGDPSTSTSTQDDIGLNALAANALAANALAANALAANALAPNALAANALAANALAANALLTDASGRSVYSYIVSCALPAGIVVIADVPSAADTPPGSPFTCVAGTCTFPGNLGLTPGWANQRLDKAGQGWISACLFSRVSEFGTPDEISMRGSNPSLAVSPAEEALYTVQEGAFYGNWFERTAWVPADTLACEGEGQVTDPNAGGLHLRACARPDPANPGFTNCGFTFMGFCGDYTPQVPSPHACATFNPANGGFYDQCKGPAPCSIHPAHGLPRMYSEVITTYVPQ
jgi:hypothetical protein